MPGFVGFGAQQFWLSAGTFRSTDGTGASFSLPPFVEGSPRVLVLPKADRAATTPTLVQWDAHSVRYTAVAAAPGAAFSRVFSAGNFAGRPWDVRFVAWLTDTTALASVERPIGSDGGSEYTPALVDLSTGVVSPFEGVFRPPGGWAWPTFVVAVAAGPFAKVVGAGDCLNVRAAPSLAGGVVGCYRDGVLLRRSGESREAEGMTWLAVTTPGGAAGWAAANFLELLPGP